ncbi:hypothetical protein FKM82_015476 [Ascaphus truei]
MEQQQLYLASMGLTDEQWVFLLVEGLKEAFKRVAGSNYYSSVTSALNLCQRSPGLTLSNLTLGLSPDSTLTHSLPYSPSDIALQRKGLKAGDFLPLWVTWG